MVNSHAEHTGYDVSRKLKEKADILLSREQGTVYKDPGGKINIALVYPNTYHVGMSNLGFQGIYGLLNSMRDVVCERAFLPDESEIDEYSRTQTELFSMESKRPLHGFDIVAFSVSFENDYPNIAGILRLSKIPVRRCDRNSRQPLVIMGGVCAFLNPEPVSEFFDICFTGEADEMLPEFIDVVRNAAEKSDILKTSLSVSGLYVPGFYSVTYGKDGTISGRAQTENAPESVRKRCLQDISQSKINTSIITSETEFSKMFLIEIMRGCPWNCRFCAAGKIYAPPRRKDLRVIEKEAQKGLADTKRIGLIGPSLSDYPHIKDVLEIPGVDFSITSLRAGSRSADLVSLMKGHKSVSIAPEAGTERLRKVIDKRITEEDILNTAELLFAQGIETLRLYFMVGLPTETREDIDAIIGLVKKIRAVSAKGYITLSVGTFVPKPFTPFQWHSMEEPMEVKERLKMIKKAIPGIKGARIFHDVPKYSFMQGLFALGDRRVSIAIEKMLKTGDWTKAAEAAGVDPAYYIFRRKDFTEILPWDFIDMGLSKDKLWAEYREALCF